MPWLCSFFQESGNAPPDGGASAFILPAAAAVALFWFCWYTVFSTGVFDHHHEAAQTHTNTHRSKKSGRPRTRTQNLPKKRETTPLKTDVFLPLFSAHGRTDGRTHRKLKATGLNYCIKKYIQVSNNLYKNEYTRYAYLSYINTCILNMYNTIYSQY